MAFMTLAQHKINNPESWVTGLTYHIIEQDPSLFQLLPWLPYSGSAEVFRREITTMTAAYHSRGGAVHVSNDYELELVTVGAESMGTQFSIPNIDLLNSASSPATIDPLAGRSMSAARALGNMLREQLVVGSGTGGEVAGLINLCHTSQYVTDGVPVGGFSFSDTGVGPLDALLNMVRSKGKKVDALFCSAKVHADLVRYCEKLPAVGPDYINSGNSIGSREIAYLGIPIIKTEYLTDTETAGAEETTGGAFSSIFAVCFDSGYKNDGIAMIYPEKAKDSLGFNVIDLGPSKTDDVREYRVTAYLATSCYHRQSIARLTNIKADGPFYIPS